MEYATLNTSSEVVQGKVPKLRPSADHVTSALDPIDESVQLLMTTTERLWQVFPPVLLALGTCGNVLCIAVLSSRNMRRSSAALYLIVLAIVDTMVLHIGLLRQWLIRLANMDIRELSPVACKLHTWIVNLMLDMSVWILVTLAFERLISVVLPYHVKRHCSALNSCVVLSVIAVVLMAITSHFLYGLGIVQVTEVDRHRQVKLVRRCIPLGKEYKHFITRVWPWIDLCVYSLVPLSLIVVCNSAIIIKVFVRRQNARRVSPFVGHSSLPDVQADDARHRKMSSMTVTLMTLNLVMLLTTLPISAYLIVEPNYASTRDPSSKQYDPKVDAELSLAWAIVIMLMYTNNSINFLLYCVSGTRFREELLNLIRNRRYSIWSTHTIHSTRIQETKTSVTQHPVTWLLLLTVVSTLTATVASRTARETG